MGAWTTTAPKLLGKNTWSKVVDGGGVSVNHYSLSGSYYIARLSKTQYAIRFDCYSGKAKTGYDYWPPDHFVLQIANTAGTVESTYEGLKWGSLGQTQTVYYIGEAADNTKITAITRNSTSWNTAVQGTLTVPEFLGGLYCKINGEWKTTTPWVNVNGVWKQAVGRIKIDGSWV